MTDGEKKGGRDTRDEMSFSDEVKSIFHNY